MGRTSTANGKMIQDLMVAHKVKGNHKDFVIIVGSKLMDWTGTYDIRQRDKPVEARAMALIHKSKLRNVIGPELAGVFWRRGLGRVGHVALVQSLLKHSAEVNKDGRSDQDEPPPRDEPDEVGG